ncbi:hypothetical protein MMA231_02824 [Asticcacaulis sp. MM231]|uniref:DUF4336 domain-containing protein n=1 Tax=Asticcacaulis sp. MM231 TaxID=3157666 RepID=UPI0032D5751F
MLVPFGDEIWIADGTNVQGLLGFHFPTRMAVIRLCSGDLFIWSPVALSEDLRIAVNALGRVRHLVAPNTLHHLFISDWAQAYPDAQVHGAPGVTRIIKTVPVDNELGNTPSPAWLEEIDQVIMEGNRITREVVFFHRSSSTALFTDLLQQYPASWFTGWRALIAEWDGLLGSEPGVPRKFRSAFNNRRAARTALKHILSWPTTKVLMAHGEPITKDGRDFLIRAFRWLKS